MVHASQLALQENILKQHSIIATLAISYVLHALVLCLINANHVKIQLFTKQGQHHVAHSSHFGIREQLHVKNVKSVAVRRVLLQPFVQAAQQINS